MNDIYICRECGAVAACENELVCPACESLNLDSSVLKVEQACLLFFEHIPLEVTS